jgi:hypothetical protein
MSFRIEPLPAPLAAHLRSGATVVVTADESPGYPCRACLCDAALGDELVLVSHDPFGGWAPAETSPYRSASPVFLHRDDCSDRVDTARVPSQLTRRRLSVRAYDERAMMRDGQVIEGVDLESTLDEIARRGEIDRVFVHFAGPGCFAAAVEIDGGGTPAD